MQILCFGDSNTYGYDPRDFGGDRYDADNRWVDLLGKQTGFAVINAGSNGRVIPANADVRKLYRQWQTADILLIMLGTNDLLQSASAAEVTARMEHFLKSILPHCRQILLISPPPLKRGAWVPTDALVAESILLAVEYQNLARDLKIPFADTRNWNVELAFDGVHFTESGHHTFADNLEKLLLS